MVAVNGDRVPTGLPSDWNGATQTLVNSLEGARYFRGSLVIVHGPPGIGKTRLIDGALAEANISSRRIRRTFLEPQDTESPYKAVLSLARWAAKLEEIAPTLESGSLVLMPFIRSIASNSASFSQPRLGSSAPGQGGSSTAEYQRLIADLEFYKRGVEAWGERSRFLHEVGWLILDAAARRHIVWVVEGAQYLDPSSLAVIRHLAACLEDSPLVMWLNVDVPEDGKLPDAIASFADGPRAQRIDVPRLSLTGVKEVLSWKYPTQTFTDRAVESLLKESKGLLLTVEQCAGDPHWLRGLAPRAPTESSDAISLGLRSIEKLDATARELVERLAAMGLETTVQMAASLSHREGSEVQKDLESLVSAGVLLEQDPGHFCFRLGGLPAEIVSKLPEEKVRKLHEEAARVIEASHAGREELIFELADHWRRAEVWEAAAGACLAAARFSSDSFAPDGGLLYAEHALEAARKMPERRPVLEAEVLIEKGRALYDLGRLHESLGTLREALALVSTDVADWPLRARALFYLARALSSLRRPQEALELVQEATKALSQVDDARARLMFHQVIGVALMMSGQDLEAAGHFRSMLTIAEELKDPREVSYAQKNLSAVLLTLNPHDEEGWRLVASALEQHTKTNNYAGLAAGYLNRSLTKLQLKDTAGALEDLGRSRQAAELAHAPLLITSATLEEVTARLDRMDTDRAASLLKGLAPWMSAMEESWARVSYCLLMGRVADAQQRPEDAERLYEEAAALAESGGSSPSLWECRLRLANLAKRRGATEQYQRLRESLPTLDEIAKVAPSLASLREKLDAPAS